MLPEKKENHRALRLLLTAFFSMLIIVGCGGGGNTGGEGPVSPDPDPEDPIVGPQTPGPTVVPDNPGPTDNNAEAPLPVAQVIPAAQQRVIGTSEVRAYRPQAIYASVLNECAFLSENYCALNKLPYLGQSNSTPTVEDVMGRVLVTHDWMGVRFETLLKRMPADILTLFAPVTAVVIGSDVRPSSFTPSTGVMRIDPWYLWMSVPEKRTISTDDDPRSGNGPNLKFLSLRRLSIGDNFAFPSSSLTDDRARQPKDLDIPMASLLFHELAHANDYVQIDKLSGLSLTQTPYDAVISLIDDNLISDELYDDASLTAQRSFLYGLGGVLYLGKEATALQNSYLADAVGAQMGNEGKVKFYAYSTPREDVATLFESVMMKHHYNVDMHVAFVNKPASTEGLVCDDYKVEWGVRNRIASPLVATRAQYVTDKIMPASAALNRLFAGELGQATPLRTGDGWCESRTTNPLPQSKRSAETLESTMMPFYK